MVKRDVVAGEQGSMKQEIVKREEEDGDCIITAVVTAPASRAASSTSRKYESESAARGRMKGKAKAKQNAIKKNTQKAQAKKRSSTNTQPKKNVKEETKVKRPSKALSKVKDEGHFDKTRGAVFRKAPSRKVMERVYRVNCQRMFLLDREQKPEADIKQASSSSSAIPTPLMREEFKVLGSTGNVYTVNIDRKPRCDCPDWMNNGGDPCKHTIFVFLRVLGISQNSHTWYQKALISSELQDIFASARPDPTHSNPSLQSAYLKAASGSKKEEEEEDTGDNSRRRIPQKGDVCPICYEEFAEGISKDLVFCEESCGNPLHKKCASEWSKACKVSLKVLKCIYCRTYMVKKGEVTITKEGNYMNMAGPSSRTRDFSVYSWSSMWAMRRSGAITEEEYRDHFDDYASSGNESDDEIY